MTRQAWVERTCWRKKDRPAGSARLRGEKSKCKSVGGGKPRPAHRASRRCWMVRGEQSSEKKSTGPCSAGRSSQARPPEATARARSRARKVLPLATSPASRLSPPATNRRSSSQAGPAKDWVESWEAVEASRPGFLWPAGKAALKTGSRVSSRGGSPGGGSAPGR